MPERLSMLWRRLDAPGHDASAIRRMNLAVGGERSAAAAWLDTADWRLRELEQCYKRIGEYAFDYQASAHDYREQLRVDNRGIVVDYPGLWMLQR